MMNKKDNLVIFVLALLIMSLAVFVVVQKINDKNVNKNQNININKITNNNINQNINVNTNSNNTTEKVNYYEIIKAERTDCKDDLDTSCWQTFKNKKYGFEFMVPEDWEIDDQKKSYAVIVKRKSQKFYLIRINLGIIENKENKKMEDLCKSDSGEEVLSCENIIINDYTFKKQIILGMGEYTIHRTIKDNYIFSFVGYPFGKIQEHKNVINKIFSTFKFLN